MPDPERIFLQPDEYRDEDSGVEGRTWASTNVSGEDTEYVRADLFEKMGKCDKCGTTFESPEEHCPNNAWDDVLEAVGCAWPGRALVWDLCPTELIVELVDERDELQAQLASQQELLDKWPRVFFESMDPRSSAEGNRVVSVEADTSGDKAYIGIMMEVDGEEICAPDNFGLYFSREALEAAGKETPDD